MASGTPVLMSPLPSMPKEYKQYLYLFEDESIKGMKLMIEEVLSFKSDDLKSKGYTARDFILKNKNELSEKMKKSNQMNISIKQSKYQ